MSPREPTTLWFDNIETKTKLVLPDNTISSYYITVREYHQNMMRNQREAQRYSNRREIDILRRQEIINRLNEQAESFGPNRPPRQQGESMTEYIERLRRGF